MKTCIKQSVFYALIFAFLLLALCIFVSCQKKTLDFTTIINKIDNNPKIDKALYLEAANIASNSQNKLSILKRALSCDLQLAVECCNIIIKNGTLSDSVSLVILSIFLDTNNFDNAIALFDETLDPKLYPSQYTETISLAIKAGVKPNLSISNLVLLTDFTKSPNYIINAAIDAMTEGDIALAQRLLNDKSIKSDSIPLKLAWDSSCLNYITNYPYQNASPIEMSMVADSFYLLGKTKDACSVYEQIIKKYPKWSWKPYAALSRLSPDDIDNEVHWAFRNNEDQNSISEKKQYYLDTMLDLFPNEADANIEYSVALYQTGKINQAEEKLQNISGANAVAVRSRFVDAQKRPTEAMRLASEYPNSSFAISTALYLLAKAGAWEEFIDVLRNSENIDCIPENYFFWNTLALLLDGDIEKARQNFKLQTDTKDDYVSAYNLGIIELNNSRYSDAIIAFNLALRYTKDVEKKVAAYINIGIAEYKNGNTNNALAAFNSALSYDPSSREAKKQVDSILNN